MPSAVRDAARHGADAVAQPDAVVAALALVGALAGREDHERAPRRAEHVRPALRARPLLDQHELAPVEVDAGLGQHRQHLEREVDVAVEVLVQRVPVALAVAQDQRRRPLLARGAAAREQLARARAGRRRPRRPAAPPTRWRSARAARRRRRAAPGSGPAAGGRSSGSGRRRSGGAPSRSSSGSARRRRGRRARRTPRRRAAARDGEAALVERAAQRVPVEGADPVGDGRHAHLQRGGWPRCEAG